MHELRSLAATAVGGFTTIHVESCWADYEDGELFERSLQILDADHLGRVRARIVDRYRVATSGSKEYQRVARFILARDSKDAPYLLNSVSIRNWRPATARKMTAKVRDEEGDEQAASGQDWADEAAALSARGTLAFDKDAERNGLPDSLFQPLVRDAVAYISGHDELVCNWRKAHAAWLAKRKDWESKDEHKRYLALRGRFDEFEKLVGGKAGKRRERWHLYLKWLQENPDLAAWRGGPAVVPALSEEARARVANARPWKQRSVEAEEFWKANPELKELDRLHGYYEREFVRRRKTKKNPDGFHHRPTFTLPHAVLHPRWTLFNAPQTSPPGYKDLILPGDSAVGSVCLRLPTGERCDERWPDGWVCVKFRSDPRLARFRSHSEARTIRKGKRNGETTETQVY